MRESDRVLTRRATLRSIAGALAAGCAIPGGPGAGMAPEAPKVNYRDPRRDYVLVPVGARAVHVEKSLQSAEPAVARRAVDRLAKNIGRALDVLPDHASFGLRNIRYYLMYGPKAPGGGRDNGLEYIHPQNAARRVDLDPRWGDSIVVYCAQNYVSLSDLWAIKAIVHEFAHAYQLHDWPEDQPEILAPYRAAMARGLYRNVKDVNGKLLEAAYATTNQLEYFAELSCMYFVGCNYKPFDRSELKAYDPAGFAMIERFWRVGAGASEKAPAKRARRARR